MTALIIIFAVFVAIVALFCVTLVIREIIIEERERKYYLAQPTPVAVQPTPVVVQPAPVAPQPTQVVVQPAPIPTPVVTEPAGDVSFERSHKTLEEKYKELTKTSKGYYDEIVKTAKEVEGYRCFKNDNYEEYKLGANRLVRLKIKRGTVIAELLIPNLDFKNFIADSNVEAKVAPTTFKVEDKETLEAVKDGIALAVKVINEERALKKEKANERRRQSRQANKAKEAGGSKKTVSKSK